MCVMVFGSSSGRIGKYNAARWYNCRQWLHAANVSSTYAFGHLDLPAIRYGEPYA
jgi:hypothetical protein